MNLEQVDIHFLTENALVDDFELLRSHGLADEEAYEKCLEMWREQNADTE